MVELNEPVRVIIYLTLVSVDAAVLCVHVLLSAKVIMSRVMVQCLLSKLCFALSVYLFYDDRASYVTKCFVFSTLVSLLPTVKVI